MTVNHLAYYQRREAQERVNADASPTDLVRRIHLQLAEHYARLIETGLPGAL